MQLDGYTEALREDLARVAAVGGQSTAAAAELLAMALEPAFARRMQEALAEAALELSGQLDDGSVEVRISGGEPELVYVRAEAPVTGEAAGAVLNARLTLRLPEGLKSRLEAAASAGGVSANTWLVQMLGRALEPRPSTGGSRRRLIGYGRS